MQAKLITAILGIPDDRQKLVLNIVKEALEGFVHLGIYNEETLLQVLAVHTKDLTPQEKAFGIYYAGRYVEKFLGTDMPLNKEEAINQIYKSDTLDEIPSTRR